MTDELNKGFLRMNSANFSAWNANATAIANGKGMDCTSYTYYFPDVNPSYVWARVEHDFITNESLLSYEDAILSGMNIN